VPARAVFFAGSYVHVRKGARASQSKMGMLRIEGILLHPLGDPAHFSRSECSATGRFQRRCCALRGEIFRKTRARICKAMLGIVTQREGFYLAFRKMWLDVVDNAADTGLFLRFLSDSILRIFKKWRRQQFQRFVRKNIKNKVQLWLDPSQAGDDNSPLPGVSAVFPPCGCR
jgi:hypothetical protein